MSSQSETPDEVAGERSVSRVDRQRSMQSRMSNILAVSLMSVLGLSALTWYYANAMTRRGRSQQSAQAAATSKAQSDMALPSLGRIDVPAQETHTNAPPDMPVLAASTLAEIPLNPSAVSIMPLEAPITPAVKSPADLELERRLAGVVFAVPSNTNAIPQLGLSSAPVGSGGSQPFSSAPSGAPEIGSIAPLLRPHVAPAVAAQVLATQRLLLPKGAFIDCTLETAIDSTLPGMTTCIMATDTFGADGKVVLLERGTKLTGETRGQVQQGSARVFVLWNEARTPAGVIVPLDSPGADELGRSGLPGEVNHHFWERFGAAMLVSVVDGVIQAGIQSSRHDSTSIVLNPTSTQDVITEVLKNTVNITPTVVKRNGDRIQVLVARDLDFRSVYELRTANGR